MEAKRGIGIEVVNEEGYSYTPEVKHIPGREVAHALGDYVLLPWVASAGLKMQSILISGLRAPDAKTEGVKKIVRWMRERCQTNADPNKKSYMEGVALSGELIEKALDEMEYLPCHYVHHLADALAVIAYFHPTGGVRSLAYQTHFLIAEELFHFKPETQDEFLTRHRDKL